MGDKGENIFVYTAFFLKMQDFLSLRIPIALLFLEKF